MANFTYKCIPVPTVINTGSTGHEQAVSTYQGIINNAADGGWELVNIDTVTSKGIFNRKMESVTFKLLVFKKPI